MEQDERAQDPKEWRHERTLEKHERSAHEQGPPSSDAQADWWHGWSTKSHETDGFRQGYDGNVRRQRQVVSFPLSHPKKKRQHFARLSLFVSLLFFVIKSFYTIRVLF